MDRLLHNLGNPSSATLLLALTLLLAAVLLFRRRQRGVWSIPLSLLSAVPLIAGIGAALAPHWGVWVAAGGLLTLLVMILVVILFQLWWPPLAWAASVATLFGLGAWSATALDRSIAELSHGILNLRPTRPLWLIGLVLLPWIVYLSFRSLAGLGPTRRWLAIGLRCFLVLLLLLALADLRLRLPNDALTVLFVLDRSLSVPEERDNDQPQVDRRWERIKTFINESVRQRGDGHERDKAGVIVFGRQPSLELPPSDAPRLNLTRVESSLDTNSTDIAAALKLALASFPEGSAKRIVLISDGNENLGRAEDQARIAKQNGVQIDVVPLAAGIKNENEVLIQSVDAVSQTDETSFLTVRVLLRNYNPKPVVGTLTLVRRSEGRETMVADPPPLVRLEPGLNSIPFKDRLNQQRQSYTYEAVFEPKGVQVAPGDVREGLAGDRWQNNRATTHVVAVGQRRILFLQEPINKDNAGHAFLLQQLRAAARARFRIDVLTVDRLPQDRAELGVFLSNYDCVIIANVAANWLNDEQQEMLRSNTHDQGCGLVMIGGPESYGAGGWQGTPVEKALPVDADIKSIKIEGKGGVALIMHASEMADGNHWQKEIAKIAIKKLSVNDEVGVLFFDWGGTKWHVPLQRISTSNNRNRLLGQVDTLSPGDMPEFDTGLKMAHTSLMEPERALATRHVIIISDGDPMQQDKARLAQMKKDRVTVTTVGVATHGPAQDAALKSIADATGGRYHLVTDPKLLPAIYIKEVRLVSRSFVVEGAFKPRLRVVQGGPTDNLPEELPPLHGYVRTTPKPSLLVETAIDAPGEQRFPILAYWQYGLGRAVAFTSDARTQPPGRAYWDRDWAGSELYTRFWEQVVDWALRPTETGQLKLITRFRDGKVHVTLDASESKQPLDAEGVDVEVTVTTPGQKGDTARRLKFERKGPDSYEAEFPAEESGSYFLNGHLTRRVKSTKDGQDVWKQEILDSVRSGVTVPYALEFADMETNSPLLERLREITGGKTFADNDRVLADAARAGDVFRRGAVASPTLLPVWHWLLFLSALTLLGDVAVRRIAVEPNEAIAWARRSWERLRGQATVTSAPAEFIERLKSRKAQIDESLERERAERRFDVANAPAAAPPSSAVTPSTEPAAATPPAHEPKPGLAPDKAQPPPEDYASRLLKAKKKVWEERDK
jgi:uncharacterized membrane protein